MDFQDPVNQFESTLDSLIENAVRLSKLRQEGLLDGAEASCEKQQEELLARLFTTHETIQKTLETVDKETCASLELKMQKFSHLNAKLLKTKSPRFVKKARVHRNRKSVQG